MKSENFEMALDEIVWLIMLLGNQSILIRNLKNKNSPEELLTEEEVIFSLHHLTWRHIKLQLSRRCSKVQSEM